MNDSRITLFYAPHSRASVTLGLMEELDVPYDLQVLSLKSNQQRGDKYLAVNPMGKVPAVLYKGVLVTEQPAVYMFLADLYAEKGLAPAIGDPLRGAYLRWMVFYGSSFEPAVVDRAMQNKPADPSTCPYGDFETMLATLESQLKQGPWMLGERFTALDVLWGVALRWTTGFKLVPESPVIKTYTERANALPSVQKARAKDAEYAAKQ